ncbi:MAG: hypothetical protein GW928_02280 [Rhodoferax sp.]|nr:hypothetical protein [Rhodoferax sp.]PJC20512.1 MAG: hypothetical protein CO065_05280 [Comamonadaceae bacterium CG_4_9_14_0_8_um_filter_57_21]
MSASSSPLTLPALSRRTVWQLAAGVAGSAALAGCGFKLRGSQAFAFSRIAIMPHPGGGVAQELRRSFGPSVLVLAAEEPLASAPLVLELANEQREKTVVGVNASGQVLEYQLRMRVQLRLRTAKGKVIIEGVEISQQRDISFSESAVLAKEAEEILLYRDMQTDIVQQILRRLSKLQAVQLD